MKLRSIILFLASFIFSACTASNQDAISFDPTMFENDQYDVALGFDLRDDDWPVAGLVINTSDITEIEMHAIALPFETSEFEKSNKLFSTWGSFSGTTIVTYYLSPSTTGTFSIGLRPTFQTVLPTYYNYDDIDSSVALVKFGAERVFVYRYPDQDTRRPKWLQQEQLLSNTEFDAIGVAYPRDAIPIGIRDTQQTAIPTPFPFRNFKAKFYPANSKLAGENALEVRYQLPPTNQQNYFVEFGSKLFAVILVPLVKLLVKKSNDKKQKTFIYILLAIQGIILITLLILFIRSWNVDNINTFLNMITVIVGGSLAYYLLVKDQEN